ncbi:MAG TPA: proteasome accessory factor PafA2 family protein, partial [Marmoricola sp.]|nr:proteasome accessory factor PafA2 family protein [Marmoricola sp.]
VIGGDANLFDVSNLLKVGTTSLVLAMVESGYPLPNLELVTPVAALKQISHDPTLKATVSLKDGRELSGLDLQRVYLNLALDFAGSNPDPATVEVLQLWQEVLDRLQVDLFSCADLLDWVAKLRLLRSFRERDGLSWGDAKLQLIDLQYHDIRPEKGLYLRLLQSNRFQRLLTDAEIERAMHEPPSDTRAYFRGRCLSQYPDNVAAASWDSVIFDLPGYDSLQRIPTMDPLRGGQQQVADLLDRHPSALGLFEELTRG